MNRVRNGQISLIKEHYEYISNQANWMVDNRKRYPSGICTVEGRSGTSLVKAEENRKRFYDYHVNANENLVLEEIIDFYLYYRNQVLPGGLKSNWSR